ncbi:MAG: FixH family protein [Burkholderiales bacterium]
MNLSVSLFGGAVLVIIMHLLLGRIGVPNFWRGVISAAAASFMILAYSLIVGMSLDLVSIHLAVFLSAATVMTLISSSATRQSDQEGIHWTIKIMVAFFLVLFLVNGAFVSMSTNGIPPGIAAFFLPNAQKKPVYTAFSGVTRHDEQAASAQNQHLQMISSLKELGWGIEIDGVRVLVTGPQAENALTLKLADRNHQPIDNAAVKISFFRAGNEIPLAQTQLVDTGKGNYSGHISIPGSGSWIMRTTISAGGKFIEVERNVMVKKAA